MDAFCYGGKNTSGGDFSIHKKNWSFSLVGKGPLSLCLSLECSTLRVFGGEVLGGLLDGPLPSTTPSYIGSTSPMEAHAVVSVSRKAPDVSIIHNMGILGIF